MRMHAASGLTGAEIDEASVEAVPSLQCVLQTGKVPIGGCKAGNGTIREHSSTMMLTRGFTVHGHQLRGLSMLNGLFCERLEALQVAPGCSTTSIAAA